MANKSVGILNLVFGADLRGFERAMKKAQKKIKKFGSSMKRTGSTLTTSLTMPILALGVVGVKAFDKQQKAIAQMEAGLKSTGNQVGITSKELQKMAADLQKTTLFGDEEILQGATAQLLTFTNIAGDQFKRTQKVALDLATRLDGDLKSASIMLGKALNDPVANLSALSRAGIQFSTDQKATVKSLVETNRLADAQNIILKELETQYGGSAEAAAKAGLGPITQLGNALSDMSEDIGKALLPMIKDLADWIKKMAAKFDNLSDSQKENAVKWGLIIAAVGPVLMLIGQMSMGVAALIPIIGSLGGAFTRLTAVMLANPYLAAAAAIAAIGVAIYAVIASANEFSDSMEAVNDVNLKAEKSIVSQKLAVEELTAVLKDENASLEDKEKALAELNQIAPTYYGKLSAAKTDIEALDTATKNYIGTLRAEARAMAAQEKMVEIEKKILEEESKLKKKKTLAQELSIRESGDASFIDRQKAHLNIITGVVEKVFTGKTGYEKTSKRLTDLKNQSSELAKIITELPSKEPVIVTPTSQRPKSTSKGRGTMDSDSLDAITPILPIQLKVEPTKDKESLFGGMGKNEFMRINNELEEEWENTTKTLEEQTAYTTGILIEDFTDAVDKIKKVMGSLSGVFSAIGDKESVEFDMWVERQEEKKDILDTEMEDELTRVEEKGFNEKREAEEKALVEEEYAQKKAEIDARIDTKERALKKKQAQRDKAMKIASAIMSTAEAVAANIALPPLAALIGILGAIQVGVIASTPIPFAKGGLVSGATLGLLGEGSGTSAFNPEVVSPLDKLMGMMGGTDVDVHGRIEGNNIVLVSDKAEISRQRFI